MNEIVVMLNKQVANWTVLHFKLHNFHWNVKGPQFFTLHAKFEEFYGEAARHIDELAERVLAIGEKPTATLREALELASIREAAGNETAAEMVQALIDDFSLLIDEASLGAEVAESLNDHTTEDLLLDLKAELEKHVWMLRAFAQ
ncbi:DNA starvation/stationary phase protection protein [Brevibacillus humidisoli]|uniref:Dps family protein n=1 Tax=Brevibacillus humidisoli TaxID=2895522 RepID=UPI001E480092|nr:Dps family protein [Brevibacillus humidisoli]UFJ40760.1 DNA starvation/stationary phase protection protein [Brevibacillus humidisoli]